MPYRLSCVRSATLTGPSAVSRVLSWCPLALPGLLAIGLASSSAAYASGCQAPVPAERVHLQLSETVVAAGETLWLQGLLKGEAKSAALYVEVLNRGGTVWQGIFPVQEQVAQGNIPVPDTLASGWYQVRAYTQWMRNAGATAFATRPLLVINPYRETKQIISGAPPSAETSEPASTGLPHEISVTLDQKSYRPRDSVAVTLRLNSLPDSTSVAVSVRKVHPLGQEAITKKAMAQRPTDLQYLVEDEGLTISGSVREARGEAGGRMAILSIPGPDPYFEYSFVDSADRFYLPIKPYQQGHRDVIVQMSDTSLQVQWTLDEKFAPENTYASASFPALVDSAWQVWQAEYIRRAQITTSYASVTKDSGDVSSRERSRFYGPPNYEINLDEYTPLPTFLEVNRELLVGVRLREKNGRYDMDVFDIPNRTFLDGEPSVLVDGVFIYDINYLIDFPPDQIERIETVNRRTYYGEYRFDGTVAVYTKSGNAYEPVLLPSALATTVTLYTPYRAFTVSDPPPPYEPDFRTLLHWQPAVRLTDHPLTLSFVNADELGEFEVVVEGVTVDGQRVYGRQSYTVSLNETP